MLQQSSIFTKGNADNSYNVTSTDKVLVVIEASRKIAEWVARGKTHERLEYQIYSSQSKESFSEEVIEKANGDKVYSCSYAIDNDTNKLVNRKIFINLDKIILSHQTEEYREIFEGHCIPYTLSNLLIAIVIGEVASLKQVFMFHQKDELEHLLNGETIIKTPIGRRPDETKYYWLFSPAGTYKRFIITTHLRMCIKKLKQECPSVLTVLD